MKEIWIFQSLKTTNRNILIAETTIKIPLKHRVSLPKLREVAEKITTSKSFRSAVHENGSKHKVKLVKWLTGSPGSFFETESYYP